MSGFQRGVLRSVEQRPTELSTRAQHCLAACTELTGVAARVRTEAHILTSRTSRVSRLTLATRAARTARSTAPADCLSCSPEWAEAVSEW